MKTHYKNLKFSALLLSLSLLASCGSSETTTAPAPAQTTPDTTQSAPAETTPTENNTPADGQDLAEGTALDRAGNSFVMPESVDKIISMSPSTTEILIGLGLADHLAVVDDYSAYVEGVPTDALIVEMQTADIEALLSADCSVLIATEHNMAGGDDPYAQLTENGVPVVYIPTATTLEDIYMDILFLGELTDTYETAEEIVATMENRVVDIAHAIKDAEPKAVYFEIAPAPDIFSFGDGTFLNEAITLAGGENIFQEEDGWFAPSEEEILSKNPDVIITNASYMEDPVGEILARENWSEVTAVADGQVYMVDNDASARPSQNVIGALEEMAAAIHPDLFS